MGKKSLPVFGTLGIFLSEASAPKYPNLPQVIAQRTTPGILIFTPNRELAYINPEALDILNSLGAGSNGPPPRSEPPFSIPETVFDLCDRLKLNAAENKSGESRSGQGQTPCMVAMSATGSEAYSFRAFFLSSQQPEPNEGGYILVLIERVSPAKQINIQKTAQRYKLSRREIEVVQLLILGHKNKEIADKLCVCVYTVEDHLKKIMKKMQVGNRTSIFAKLLEGA